VDFAACLGPPGHDIDPGPAAGGALLDGETQTRTGDTTIFRHPCLGPSMPARTRTVRESSWHPGSDSWAARWPLVQVVPARQMISIESAHRTTSEPLSPTGAAWTG
jgi:hypothetical protein